MSFVSPSVARRAGAALVTLVLFAVLVGAISKMWQFGIVSPFTDPLDFRAFYCAGSAVAQRADPYRLEPDRSCQRRVLEAAGLRFDDFVLPAPLPPYALTGFAALSLLPYRFASALWMSGSIVALFASIFLLSRLSGTHYAFAGLAFALSAGLVCLTLGQIVPFVLASVLFAAVCARRGNGIGAATGAMFAAVEPHLALPVWVALALFVPVARKPLVVAAFVLGALTLLPGAALNLEYGRSILPAHARAELINFEGQYSLSSLLAALHVPLDFATRAGSVSYAAMLVLGVALGAKLKRRFGDPAFLIVTPLAAVVVGGPFLHIQQTVVAIPLGFLLFARLPRRSVGARATLLAIVLLAIPWPLADIAFAPKATVANRLATKTVAHVPEANPRESIEIPYAAFIERFERRPDKHSLAELLERKSPTWFALLALLATATWLAFAPYRFRRSNARVLSRAA